MFEQRKQMRRRTLLDGRVMIDKLNTWSLDCAVRNLSDGGARITIPAETVVPDRFSLSISGGECRPARLVWYRDGQAGVELVERGTKQPVASHAAGDDHDRTASAPAGILAARIAAVSARRTRAPGFA